MPDHKLMPKHGEEFSLLIDDAAKRYKEIYRLQTTVSLELAAMIVLGRKDDKTITFPCKQCCRDIALQFRDLAGMIEELIAEKKPDGCGND